MKTIGKLLWHKASRESAYFPPLGGLGEVIIKVPVVFNFKHPCGVMKYEDIKLRVVLAVCNRLFKYNKDMKNKADTFASMESTVIFNNETSADALVTFRTPHLDVWQTVCNNKFNNSL